MVVVAAADSGARMLARALTQAGVSMGGAPRFRLPRRRGFEEVLDDLACANLHLPPQVRPSASDLRHFQRGACRHMQESASGSRPWGWQLPSTYMLGNFVAETFPDARLVQIVRDGREVALCERPASPRSPLRRRLEERLAIQGDPPAVQAAAIWAFQVERFIRFSARWPQPVLTLRYELLTHDPGPELHKLAHFLELPTSSLTASSLEPALEPQPAVASEAMVEKIEARVGGILRRLGYSAPEQATGRKRLPVLGS